MGAYYKAICINDNESINTWDLDNGAKLMEHSWFGNSYVDMVLHNIFKGSWKNKSIVWGCDYDDSEKFGNLYNTSHDVSFSDDAKNFYSGEYEDSIILNHTKKEFIDLVEYKMNFVVRKNIIHPFPLLTCATTESMGGGDYHPDSADRGRWAGDSFTVIQDSHSIPHDYTNISDVCFSEDENELKNRKDEMRKLSLANAGVDTSTNEPLYVESLTKGALKKDVEKLLHGNDKVFLKFVKANGDEVERTATLSANRNTTIDSSNDEKYMYFFDIDAQKVKKMIFDGFLEAKVA